MKADVEFDKYIDEALKEEPGFFLSVGFADKMAEKIRRKHALRESLREYSVYAALLLGLAILVSAFLFFINKENLPQLLSLIDRHLFELISLAFIINFILFADKVLLRLMFTFKQQ